MTTMNVPATIDAVEALQPHVRGIAEAARHLTCTETEALAELFRAVGHDDWADTLIHGHAEADDDPTDTHYQHQEAEG